MSASKKSNSKADELLLESYKVTMEAMAEYLGEAYEIVMHDLKDLDHSIVKIINGFHSGRKEGSPVTDLALSMLKQANRNEPYRIYHSKSKRGKPVQSMTMIIYGEDDKPVAMLCVNLYLDSPISSFFKSISPEDKTEHVTEHFINDSEDLITSTLKHVKQQVNNDPAIPASLKNKEILRSLNTQGVFELKKAISIVAKDLGLSKNTVYLHIREIEKQ